MFDALAWLATAYHQRRTKPGKTPDFDKLLKEACSGWSYKGRADRGDEGAVLPVVHRHARRARYDLSHHLAKGNSRDPRSTIRIAFDWDEERRQVIVGFIGLYQRNRRT